MARGYAERESVYLNKEEAELIKESLYQILGNGSTDNRDMICELVCVMNDCITENIKREEKKRENHEE